jgi:uncharacterized surface protein with fasciclin (FAS1) repeats
MLAGNIRVAAADGAFFVRGDTEANQVQISRSNDGTNSIRVTGLEGTTVNGQSEIVVQTRVREGYRINMGGGDDFVRIEDTNAGGITRVYGADGNDQVSIYQAKLNDVVVQTSVGDDSVSIDDATIFGNLRVATQGGNDTVGISGLESSGRSVMVATGEGDDQVVFRDSELTQGSLYVFTQDGDDFVGTDRITVADNSRITTGDGVDAVSVFSTKFDQNSFVNGGSELDKIDVGGRQLSRDTLHVSHFESGLDSPNGQTNQVFLGQVAEGVRLGTIAELAIVTPQLSTLVGALQATGLDAALNDPSANLTAFAPLDSAFENLPDGLLDSLSLEQLTDILLFHVTSGSVEAETLVTLDEVPTLLGQPFSVEVGDDVVLNGNVTLAATDIRAKNGVVHVLNDVLVPA